MKISINEGNSSKSRSRLKSIAVIRNINNLLHRIINKRRKVKVLSLPETIKEKSNSRRRAFARNVDFSFILFQVVREPLPFAYH